VGTEWILANGLKVIVRQGDLVDAQADVIVNPANGELSHGGMPARAISVAAKKELDDECNEYIRPFRSIKVGREMHTTAGNSQPQIKHVIHAVGPRAHENSIRQDNFDLVQRAVVCSLELAEYVLNATSIALPAISARLFGVPKIDVAQALYQAILKFDETEPRFVKSVQLVNLDRCVTDLINREFAWWFGGVPKIYVSTACRTTILQNLKAKDLGQDHGMAKNENGISLVRRIKKKKEYIPEKFTYFWLCYSPFSQHFKSEFVIDGRLFNCPEKWMMQQKCIVFGQLEFAEKIMQMEDPKAMKRAAQIRGIPSFNQSIWDRHSYRIVHERNMHKLAQNLELYVVLKGTVGTTLVEASPFDIVWGCGCREQEPAVQQRKTWRGLNWLGEILTQV